MSKSLPLAILAGASLASTLSANVVEAFNYALGSIADGQAATGTGQTGNWGTYAAGWLGGLPAGDPTSVAVSGSLSAPTGYAFTPTNNRLSSDANTFGMFSLEAANRINFDADGTYYFSYLFNLSNPLDSSADRGLVEFRDSGNGTIFAVGDNVFDQDLRINTSGTNAGESGGSNFVSGDILIVGKIETSASGADTISAQYFSGSVSSEPVTWDVSRSSEMTGTAMSIGFNSNGLDSGTIYQFDEFRLGDSWAAVVPEPSTYALLSGVLALGCIMMRRRK